MPQFEDPRKSGIEGDVPYPRVSLDKASAAALLIEDKPKSAGAIGRDLNLITGELYQVDWVFDEWTEGVEFSTPEAKTVFHSSLLNAGVQAVASAYAPENISAASAFDIAVKLRFARRCFEHSSAEVSPQNLSVSVKVSLAAVTKTVESLLEYFAIERESQARHFDEFDLIAPLTEAAKLIKLFAFSEALAKESSKQSLLEREKIAALLDKVVQFGFRDQNHLLSHELIRASIECLPKFSKTRAEKVSRHAIREVMAIAKSNDQVLMRTIGEPGEVASLFVSALQVYADTQEASDRAAGESWNHDRWKKQEAFWRAIWRDFDFSFPEALLGLKHCTEVLPDGVKNLSDADIVYEMLLPATMVRFDDEGKEMKLTEEQQQRRLYNAARSVSPILVALFSDPHFCEDLLIGCRERLDRADRFQFGKLIGRFGVEQFEVTRVHEKGLYRFLDKLED